MIWAIDQDTGNFDAMGQLFGDYTNLELDGLNNNSVEDLSDLFGQFIGQYYFVTECCTKDGDDKNGPDQVCPNSFRPVSPAHNAYQKLPRTLSATATRAGFAISAIPAYPHFALRCDPPWLWTGDWPVDPERLWEIAFGDRETDRAVWRYETEYGHNDRDPTRANADEIDGSDAVFDHSEEVFYVYCNYPAEDKRCKAVWEGGVEDTIIHLPDHIGEGPWARILSMVTAEDYVFTRHHLTHRSTERLANNLSLCTMPQV
ncbi:hypothetical protein S40288_08398 [Stachybotrys chartarum IBT 40288]|nr:hypothetical protein S40288_08398 [Stachybotrys chartarum IBT 40288]